MAGQCAAHVCFAQEYRSALDTAHRRRLINRRAHETGNARFEGKRIQIFFRKRRRRPKGKIEDYNPRGFSPRRKFEIRINAN